MKNSIGFVGAGLMGRGIIKNLLKNGYSVQIFIHKSTEAAEILGKKGATTTRSLEELANQNEVFMLAVPASPEVEQVILGNQGLINFLSKGKIIIDLSTSYPESTKMIVEKLQKKGIRMLDAPMTGSTPQAEAGELNLMVGGEKSDYDEMYPIFEAIAKNIFFVGEHGAGHTVKLMNNFLGQLNVSGLSEMLVFGQKYGIDLQAFFDVVSVSGGNSAAFQGTVPKVLSRDFGVSFHLKLVHKDLRYITELGRATGAPMPIANNIFNMYDMAKAAGYGDENFSAIVKLYEKITGVEVKREKK